MLKDIHKNKVEETFSSFIDNSQQRIKDILEELNEEELSKEDAIDILIENQELIEKLKNKKNPKTQEIRET